MEIRHLLDPGCGDDGEAVRGAFGLALKSTTGAIGSGNGVVTDGASSGLSSISK